MRPAREPAHDVRRDERDEQGGGRFGARDREAVYWREQEEDEGQIRGEGGERAWPEAPADRGRKDREQVQAGQRRGATTRFRTAMTSDTAVIANAPAATPAAARRPGERTRRPSAVEPINRTRQVSPSAGRRSRGGPASAADGHFGRAARPQWANHTERTMADHTAGLHNSIARTGARCAGRLFTGRKHMSTYVNPGSVKSGLGVADGVVSELASFWTVKPGETEQLREAVAAFAAHLREMSVEDSMKTSLRDSRHVIFDNGTRLLWATTFEADWDPYFDDALLIVSVEHFLEWIKHTVEGEAVVKWYKDSGGDDLFAMDKSDPKFIEGALQVSGALKAIVQSVQTPASGYFNLMGYHFGLTQPQIQRNMQLREALDEVLEHPQAEEALEQPAMAPLRPYAAE
jgi:hypothetical protein